jgi:hypothetical protein
MSRSASQPHAFFEARDSDIHVELPVTLSEAGWAAG